MGFSSSYVNSCSHSVFICLKNKPSWACSKAQQTPESLFIICANSGLGPQKLPLVREVLWKNSMEWRLTQSLWQFPPALSVSGGGAFSFVHA